MSVVDTIYNPIDLRIRSQMSWSDDQFGAALFHNYYDSYRNTTLVTPAKIGAWNTFDLSLWFNIRSQQHPTDMRLGLAVNNLFDANPPAVGALPSGLSNLGYDPANADPLGRFVSVSARIRW